MINETQIKQITDALIGRLFVPLEASGRHVHVTKEQAGILFGTQLTAKRPLSQPGQYLAHQRVKVVGPKGAFDNVAVLGPERKEAQVEISLTDGRTLGITPPIRPSGSVADTPGITLVGPAGQVTLSRGVMAAQRHIHMTPQDAARQGVRDKQIVKLQVFTNRPVIFENVLIRVSEDFATYAHLDYDEANACAMAAGDLGRILS